MPNVDLDQGDTEQIYRAQQPGDKVFLRVTSGSARFARTEEHARAGRFLATDDKAEVVATHDAEELWLHGEENGTTVEFERQGWGLSVFGREIIRLNASETVGNMPTSLEAQNVDLDTNIIGSNTTIDQNITGQDVNVETDIVAQTVSTLTGDTAVISAEGVVEKNLDQTSTVSSGNSVTSNVTAAAGQVWRLRGIYLQAPGLGGTGTNETRHGFEVKTESQGVVIGRGEAGPGGTDTNTPNLGFEGGVWFTSDNLRVDRDDMKGQRIDDTNGLDVRYFVTGSTNDQTGTRNIRLTFDILQT